MKFGWRKLFPMSIGVLICFVGIGYFTKNKIEISINQGGSVPSAIAETDQKTPFAVPEAEAHFKNGQKLIAERKLDEALKEFEASTKLSPKTAITHYWIGMTYFYKKDYERAIAKFKKVIDLDRQNYHALAMIGRSLSLDKSKLDQSIKYLTDALAINELYSEARFDLGRVYAQKGDKNRALSEFAVIFRTEPQYAVYHLEAGRIFESMKAIDRAKGEYERALQLDPKLKIAKEALEKLK